MNLTDTPSSINIEQDAVPTRSVPYYKLTNKGARYFDMLGEHKSGTPEGMEFRSRMTETDWQLEQLLTLTQDVSMSRNDYLQCLHTSKIEGRPQIHIDMMSTIDQLIDRALKEELVEVAETQEKVPFKSMALIAFETLYNQLSLEDQRLFLRDHPVVTDILVTYNNGCNELTTNFFSLDDLTAFAIDYLSGKGNWICNRELVSKAHEQYLKMVDNLRGGYSDYFGTVTAFWEAGIRGKELKDYHICALLTIINFCHDIDVDQSKESWVTMSSRLKTMSKYDREDAMEKIFSKETEREEMAQHMKDGTIPSRYSRSNFWIIRQVSVNGNLLFSEHTITDHMKL